MDGDGSYCGGLTMMCDAALVYNHRVKRIVPVEMAWLEEYVSLYKSKEKPRHGPYLDGLLLKNQVRLKRREWVYRHECWVQSQILEVLVCLVPMPMSIYMSLWMRMRTTGLSLPCSCPSSFDE